MDETGRPGPANWAGGVYPDEHGEYPVTGISWYEAAAYANFADKTLPTAVHNKAVNRLFRTNSWLVMPRSNLGGTGLRRVGEKEAMNTLGIYDLIGNAREWLVNKAGAGTRDPSDGDGK